MSASARSSQLLFILLSALLVASCKNKEENEERCRQRAQTLGVGLRQLDHTMGVEARHVKLALRDDLPPGRSARWTILELSSEGVWARDRSMASVSQAVEALEPDGSPFVAVDGDTPWKRVTELLRALDSRGAREVTFAFRRPPVASPPPPHSAMDARLDAILSAPASDRATLFAEAVEALVADCPAVNDVFRTVSPPEDPDAKADKLIAALPAALIKCQCKCDVEALHAVLHRLLANQWPTSTVTLELSDTGPELRFPPETAWKEASRGLAPGRRLAR